MSGPVITGHSKSYDVIGLDKQEVMRNVLLSTMYICMCYVCICLKIISWYFRAWKISGGLRFQWNALAFVLDHAYLLTLLVIFPSPRNMFY